MKLSTEIERSLQWESERGIQNGNWGGDRIQAELDEAKEEDDLYKKLVEYADVAIILFGSVGAVLKHLDLEAHVFEGIIEEKRAINQRKYPVEEFQKRSVPEALAHCRKEWET